MDRAHALRRDAHDVPGPELDDVVVELALDVAREDVEDLLLGLVGMAVGALPARARRHVAPRDRDLLVLQRTRHEPHLAGVARAGHDVVGVVAVDHRVVAAHPLSLPAPGDARRHGDAAARARPGA